MLGDERAWKDERDSSEEIPTKKLSPIVLARVPPFRPFSSHCPSRLEPIVSGHIRFIIILAGIHAGTDPMQWTDPIGTSELRILIYVPFEPRFAKLTPHEIS